MNNGNSVAGIFLAFSKAFNTINHEILLAKLKMLHFSSHHVKLIKNNLANCQQSTIINNTYSDFIHITCGVPRGSILGPTLLLIYINDLPDVTKHLDPILFADYTNLFFESKNLLNSMDIINCELKKIETWCNKNKLTENIGKTSYMIIKTAKNKQDLNGFALEMFNKKLAEVKSTTFLGIIIDSHLFWQQHCSKLCQNLRPLVGLILHNI